MVFLASNKFSNISESKTMKFQTILEEFCSRSFGNEYKNHNQYSQIVAANIPLSSKLLLRSSNLNTVTVFGSKIGLNLITIKQLFPEVELSAIIRLGFSLPLRYKLNSG